MSLTIDLARRILEASKQRANELRSPVSIAIVDAGGHLILFERMMSPYGWATGNISLAKAVTAVMFNQSTDAVAQWGAQIPGFASSMATMSQGKFIMAAGGWPIRMNGATIGGIGVSGGNAPGRDDEIARAGLGVLEIAGTPMPAARYTPQAVPAYAQAASSGGLQPSPTYPSTPIVSPIPPTPDPLNQEGGQETENQENPYGDGPAGSDQYSENRGGHI
ncbi:MAG TPA: heme-binding protein [Ktedonobacteraceae bacterium]